MPERRRKFSPEFRDEAVKMVIEGNRSTAQVARELGINPGTLGNWVAQYRKAHPVAEEPLSVSDRARLRELERENQELKMRNEFLGKAAAFFAQEYRRAARDAVHFSALVDRWWQNLRRVVGWDVQYFATVEPQKRAAPHLHAALRGSFPHGVVRQVTEATYHQVWWPNYDQPVYGGDRLPVWDMRSKSFVDPDTREPLTPWDDAVEAVEEPAHVVTFGRQVHSRGILGGSEEAGRHIGYLTKYLTKSTGEVVEADSARQRDHHDRLHAELAITPCSPRCGVWLLYGIEPKGANSRTTPGHCKGRAHRRSTLGLPGRRVLVSRKWSGKSLADHKADRKAFVRDMLAAVGIVKPEQDTARLVWRKVDPGDRDAPPRAHLLMRAIAERITWKAEYDRALLAASGPPGDGPETSAIQYAA
jgi:transposase-like protein